MFYIKKDCLTQDIINKYSIAHTSSLFNKHPFSKIRVYPTDSKPLLVVVDSIIILSNQLARLTVNDLAKQMYFFVDYIETPYIVNSELSSFERNCESDTNSLFAGSVFCIEEFTFKPVGELQQEFGGDFEDYVLQGINAVKTAPENSFHHVCILTQCLLVGHVTTPIEMKSINQSSYKKRRISSHSLSDEIFPISMLSNSIKNMSWRANCCLVDMKEPREFMKRVTNEKGTCQRYLFRDKSMHIEVVAFNELQNRTLSQNLQKVF